MNLRYSLHLLLRNRLVLAGTVISLGTIFLAISSNFLVPSGSWKIENLNIALCWNFEAINWHLVSIFTCPDTTGFHLLGTDAYGRDLLSMIILALPNDLYLSFTVVVSAFLIGTVIGALSAFLGGRVDEGVLRVTDLFFSIPRLIFAIVILVIVGRSLTNVAIAVLITDWPLYVRLVRSQILSEKEKPYVEALRTIGAGNFRILFEHIIPNSIYPSIVEFTLDIGNTILIVSSLMFLGFSPSPLLPELGNLLTDGITYVGRAPWLIIFPGLTILIIALGFNLFGDGIRDLLDPRLRR